MNDNANFIDAQNVVSFLADVSNKRGAATARAGAQARSQAVQVFVLPQWFRQLGLP